MSTLSRVIGGEITLRRAESVADYHACQDAQRLAWGITEDGYVIPIATMVGFLPALEVHDATAGLWTLLRIPTLIACGDHDLLTPDEYSRKMAACMPRSELVIVAGASHLALLDKPDAINDGLIRLVNRAMPSRMAQRYRRFRDRLRRNE